MSGLASAYAGVSNLQRPLIITGAPGSPYTRKVIAAARYCRIPYRFVSDLSVIATLPQPRIKLWPTCYFPDQQTLVPETDSTPILRRLEGLAPDRRIVPSDRRLALVDALIEDYADEWLTKAMFHYRWTYASDIRKASRVLPNWFEAPLTDDALDAASAAFAERQIGRLELVGSNATTAQSIEDSFVRVLACLEGALAGSAFLLGSRPGAADFGLYGQLTQLALFDPTSSRLVDEHAPRVTAWTIAMEDLSGLDADLWTPFEELSDAVRDLLHEIGETYATFLLANEDAIGRGETMLRTMITGRPWEQPIFAYQRKCLNALRALYAELGDGDRRSIDTLLRQSGCIRLFEGR